MIRKRGTPIKIEKKEMIKQKLYVTIWEYWPNIFAQKIVIYPTIFQKFWAPRKTWVYTMFSQKNVIGILKFGVKKQNCWCNKQLL